ncbi:hypothetical protein PHET_08111 [Paragonimus heterotremus]|uniref:PH domain-containing protein n=1 Tax=Paragonimus heterotremus TaxID=100268 RepID=A0A8J4WF76_9TREM|nr:hypothetical protein PHET_08111 [Paragonimus heterotremus]
MNDKEHEQLKRLLRRAKELQIEEEKSMLRKRIEGQLLKFTNVVKGYQYRWCVVDPDSGTVEYYEKEEHKRSGRPRGTLNLTVSRLSVFAFLLNFHHLAVVLIFYFPLPAADAKERQFWVDRIRAVAEFHSDQAEHHPTIATLPDPQDKESHLSVLSPPITGSPLHSPCSGASVTRPQPRNTPVRKSGSTNKAAHPNQVHPATVSNEQRTFLLPSSDALAPELDSFPVFCSGCSAGPHAQLCELFRRLESETQALVNAVDVSLMLTVLNTNCDHIQWLFFITFFNDYSNFLVSLTRTLTTRISTSRT